MRESVRHVLLFSLILFTGTQAMATEFDGPPPPPITRLAYEAPFIAPPMIDSLQDLDADPQDAVQYVMAPTPEQLASLSTLNPLVKQSVFEAKPHSWKSMVKWGKVAFNPASKLLAKAGRWAAGRRQTVGMCLGGVQDALDVVGFKFPRMGAAADMAQPLSKDKRFLELQVPPSELTMLPAGAIVVWDRSDEHPHGHISITQGGGQESSDHLQPMKPYITPDFRVFIPKG